MSGAGIAGEINIPFVECMMKNVVSWNTLIWVSLFWIGTSSTADEIKDREQTTLEA